MWRIEAGRVRDFASPGNASFKLDCLTVTQHNLCGRVNQESYQYTEQSFFSLGCVHLNLAVQCSSFRSEADKTRRMASNRPKLNIWRAVRACECFNGTPRWKSKKPPTFSV